jgi:hypothetical protein
MLIVGYFLVGLISIAEGQSVCLPGWTLWNNTCYVMGGVVMQQYRAQAYCAWLHPSAYLANINSDAEYNYLYNFIGFIWSSTTSTTRKTAWVNIHLLIYYLRN